MIMYSICVFCGTLPGDNANYAASAREVARLLVQKNCRIVCGGGKLGLMGVLADAALAAGGHVTGIAPATENGFTHRGLSELRLVQTVHECKAMMMQLADAFLILPGGYGTLDELFEVLTLRQWGRHHKPCGLLNVDGFFDALVAYLDQVTARGFLLLENRSLLTVDADPRALLARIGVG
jgi:uncharacterized protein (TIGR00730 family)